MSRKILGVGTVMSGKASRIQQEDGLRKIIDLTVDALKYNYTHKNYSPEVGHTLIFSASNIGDEKYVALSVIRPDDLLTVEGHLTQLDGHSKYGQVKIAGKEARVFVPFSTRLAGGGLWRGVGAKIGNLYNLRVFRQEESYGCKYVAWSIGEPAGDVHHIGNRAVRAMNETNEKKLGSPSVFVRPSDHQTIDFVKDQIGVIVQVSEDKQILVSSTTCQNISLAASLYEEWMKPGRFIYFDGRRVSDDRHGVLLGSNPVDDGSYFPCSAETTLVLTLPGIVNKVQKGNRLWAWNDFIGRVLIPWRALTGDIESINPFVGVNMTVSYCGKQDDSPWVATEAFIPSDADSPVFLEKCAQLLKTEEGWTIQTVSESFDGLNIFLINNENDQRRTAYARLMDVNCNYVPAPGDKLRVTYYKQFRHNRHELKVVLLTPTDKIAKHPHLMHSGNGHRCQLERFEEPTPRKERVIEPPAPRIIIAPPPAKNPWNLTKLGPPKTSPSHLDEFEFPQVTEKAEGDAAPVAEAQDPAPVDESQQLVPVVDLTTSPTPFAVDPVGPMTDYFCQLSWRGTPAESKPQPFFYPPDGRPSFENPLSIFDPDQPLIFDCHSTAQRTNPRNEHQSPSTTPRLGIDIDVYWACAESPSPPEYLANTARYNTYGFLSHDPQIYQDQLLLPLSSRVITGTTSFT